MDDLKNLCDSLLKKTESDFLEAISLRTKIRELSHNACLETSDDIFLDFVDDKRDVESDTFVADDSFEEEFECYLQDYRSLSDDFIIDDLIDILPPRSNYDFDNILKRLIAESYKEIKEIKELLLTDDSLDAADREGLCGFIKNEQRKIAYINQIYNDKDNSDSVVKKENKIILMPSCSGNIKIISEIERIPKEFYSDILTLVESIKDGTFFGRKRFLNNDQLSGLYEVRKGDIRILYTRISSDTYVLVGVLLKKYKMEQWYREHLQLVCGEYYSIRDSIISSLEDEKFIKLNYDNICELYNLLCPCNSSRVRRKDDSND